MKSPSNYTSLSGTPLPLFAKRSRRGQAQRKMLLLLFGGASLMLLLVTSWQLRMLSVSEARDQLVHSHSSSPHMTDADALQAMYANTTQLVPQELESGRRCEQRYTLMLVADRDQASRNESTGDWRSVLRRGSLCRLRRGGFSVSWLDEVPLSSRLSYNGRGMELSDLIWFGGQLLACDDRTGVIFALRGGTAIPRHILTEEAGDLAGKGFKCEWMSIRHGDLYIGGIGRPSISRNDAVAVLEPGGALHYVNWSQPYAALREAAGVAPHGYLTHEAAAWDDYTDRWLFAPRRSSVEAFDEETDERHGAHQLLWLRDSHNGSRAKAVALSAHNASRGFSSIKLLPGSPDEVVAIKTEEVEGRVASYLTVLRTDGSVLMGDVHIASAKFEGIEVAV